MHQLYLPIVQKIQESTKLEPFYLVYGRKPILPMDKIEKKILLIQRIQEIIEEIPKGRWKAKEQIQKAQEKQKEYHDKRITQKEEFNIGDKVLYYKAAKEKQWSGKLDEKWKGPYYIYQKMLKGSYKLNDLKESILKTPIIGKLLKRYFDKTNFEPMVVI